MISLSNITIPANSPKGTVVGTFALLNASGVGMNANFILSQNSAGFFAVSDYKLVTVAAAMPAAMYCIKVTGAGTSTAWEEKATFPIIVTR